jgi:hypothetical protein
MFGALDNLFAETSVKLKDICILNPDSQLQPIQPDILALGHDH